MINSFSSIFFKTFFLKGFTFFLALVFLEVFFFTFDNDFFLGMNFFYLNTTHLI